MKVKRHYLEYQDWATNSDKFYQVFITETGTLINYGRRGTDGQTKWTSAPDFERAEVHATKKVYEKLDRGYEQVIEPDVFEVHSEPMSDGSWTLSALMRALNNARSDGSITKAADDLASKAEEFAHQVASLIASVKAKLVTESEILTNIQEMELDLERTENAIATARFGLEMARESLGRMVAT